jgi:hypothetical protein
VTLSEDGVPRLPIISASVTKPVEELRHYLQAMTGSPWPLEPAAANRPGIYVGLAADFPGRTFEGIDEPGREGFLLQSDGQSLYLIGREAPGVQHAVAALLESLGCRWYFPGPVWEVVPRKKSIAGSWNERQSPAMNLQRKIWYGFGASPECARDLADWERHNRLGGAVAITIGHTWHGLNPESDFEKHPEWFALVAGKRQPSKPCYSHPEVVKRGIEHALAQAKQGAAMISMTPPDGLGYCECELCMAACQGGKPYQEHGTTFARRPDGTLVNVTSETLFKFVNQIADAVAETYPQALVGCYAYSAYSHPPSFELRPNVFLQTTTAFRRTPLSLAEQLEAFRKIGVRSGIRGYYSVYQWDWDYPTVSKGDLSLPQLVEDLRFFHQQNVQSINSEASNNWAARGLGYYLAAQLMWDPSADPQALIADFYEKAFGPAAAPMERYYARWLGPYVAVRSRPAAVSAVSRPARDPVQDELGGSAPAAPAEFSLESLKAAYRDLDAAARLVRDLPEHRARVDHLRMYAHYLYLRTRIDAAAKARDRDAVREAVAAEAVFGARLTNANLVHSRPLLGKEFYRRFLPYKEYLEGTPEWPRTDRDAVASAAGQGFRRPRSDVPTRDEVEQFWAQDKRELGIE